MNIINKKDFVSPIFSLNEIIGYCYKYFPNFDYSNSLVYADYLDNPILDKVIKLNFNYNNISKKIKDYYHTPSNDKYYLIKISYISLIKNDYKYVEIKKLLDKYRLNDSNFQSEKKIILSIIKDLPTDILQEYFGNNKLNDKYEKEVMEPELYKVIIPNKEQVMIYNNCEIFEKDILKLFVNNIDGCENNYLECTLNEGRIIINYPQNFKGNNKYISVIGTLNERNIFIKEYIFIYYNYSAYQEYNQKLKYNIISPILF